MISEKPKNRFRTLLLNIFLISAAAHVVLLLLFGGYTVYRYVVSSGAQFDEPPPSVEEVPPPASVEVAIQRPRSSDLPRAEIRMQTVGNIAVAAIATDVPTMSESFVVADAGMSGLAGARLGGGGGLGLGMSDISVFGIRDSGERILFVIDTGRNMVVDAKGGLHSYNAIKEEIIRLTGELAPGTVFNVLLFESVSHRVVRFNDGMLAATPDNVSRLRQWFMPINQNASQVGLRQHNVRPQNVSDTPIGRNIRDHVSTLLGAHLLSPSVPLTQVMLEQDADLIYVITSEWRGFSRINRPPTEREAEEMQRLRAQVEGSTEFQRRMEAFNAARRAAGEIVNQREQQERAQRQQRGLPPRVWRHGHLDEKASAYKVTIAPEGRRDPRSDFRRWFWYSANDVEAYFRTHLTQEFRREGREIPRINIILFLAEGEDLSRSVVDNIRSYQTMFRNGRFRELRGLAAIQAFTGGEQ